MLFQHLCHVNKSKNQCSLPSASPIKQSIAPDSKGAEYLSPSNWDLAALFLRSISYEPLGTGCNWTLALFQVHLNALSAPWPNKAGSKKEFQEARSNVYDF